MAPDGCQAHGGRSKFGDSDVPLNFEQSPACGEGNWRELNCESGPQVSGHSSGQSCSLKEEIGKPISKPRPKQQWGGCGRAEGEVQDFVSQAVLRAQPTDSGGKTDYDGGSEPPDSYLNQISSKAKTRKYI